MNSFVTQLSKHCYYGNVINILNSYGDKTKESELVLISNALNCYLSFDKSLFLGISNELCEQGINKLGYQIKELDNNYLNYKFLLNSNTPILLLINTSVLTHNNIFEGTNRNHYIILLKDKGKTLEISDSFVRTEPISSFRGDTDLKPILNEIIETRATGVYFEKKKMRNNLQLVLEEILFEYIETNALNRNKSIINQLHEYCSIALENTDILFNKESLNNLAYDIKVSGLATRFDYLVDLFTKHINFSIDIDTFTMLKSKWELVASKLMKCSIVLNKEYYMKIFEVEIPALIKKELHFYQGVYEKMKSFK